MVKLFIGPTGHCSVFLRRRSEAQKSTVLDSKLHLGKPSSSSRSGQPALVRGSRSRAVRKAACSLVAFVSEASPVQGEVSAFSNLRAGPEPLGRRQGEGRHAGSSRRASLQMQTKTLDGLEPWEVVEMRYLKDVENSVWSPNFGAELRDCYFQKPQASCAGQQSAMHTELAVQPSAHDPQEISPYREMKLARDSCDCGNVYMADAAFCRKCGKKRRDAAESVVVEPSSPRVALPSSVEEAMAMELPEPRSPSRTAMKVALPSSLQGAMAMQLPESRSPSRTPDAMKNQGLSMPIASRGGCRSPSRKATPLMLLGMKPGSPADGEALANSKGQLNSPSHSKQSAIARESSAKQRLFGETRELCDCGNVYMPDSAFCRKCGKQRGSDRLRTPDPSVPSPRNTSATSPRRLLVVSPFLKFLRKKTEHEAGPRSAEEEEELKNTQKIAALERERAERVLTLNRLATVEEPAPQTEMHAKTAGFMGSLESWFTSKAPKGLECASGSGNVSVSGHKTECRTLIILSKQYSLPINEVRDIKAEFNQHDADGDGQINREEFLSLVRKRTNMSNDEEIPIHLLRGISDGDELFGFEEILRWSIGTAWSEEMMMPDANQRQLRRLAREQDMKLPDVEKVKRMFDEFDSDGSGEIEEEEFRHILRALLRVKDVTDIPLKRLQRYWREVDLDGGGSVTFHEFLVWYKSHFLKD